MSAEAPTAELLLEIKEETLDSLLSTLRASFDTHPSTPLPPLSRLLSLFTHPPPPPQNAYITAPTPRSHKPPILELTSLTASAVPGTTDLLNRTLALALLGPNPTIAILLDLSSTFSIQLLYDTLLELQASSSPTTTVPTTATTTTKTAAKAALSNLHIFRPQSPSSLLSTLHSLPKYLHSLPPTPLPLSHLILSSLPSLPPDFPPTNPSSTPHHHNTLTTALLNLQHQTSCTIITTTHALASPSPLHGHLSLRPQTPAVWNRVVAARVVVEREGRGKVGVGMSGEEAVGRERWRDEEVNVNGEGRGRRERGYVAWVNWWGGEEWGVGVREGLRALEGGGGFRFQVDVGMGRSNVGDSD